nr:hypothetical protein [Mesorhizobium sp. M1A.F.Ca.IN.020.06.1.1]
MNRGILPELPVSAVLPVLGASGLLTMVREEVRLGTVRWNPFTRTRL